MAASSRAVGQSGRSPNDHALFYRDDHGASHVFYRTIDRGASRPFHVYGGNGSPQDHARKATFQPAVEAVLLPGEFLPRVWRGLEHPLSMDVGLHDAEVSSRRVVGDLCSRLQRIFWQIEPADPCRDAFSHELRSLLLLSCTEVESSWKAILKEHQYPGRRWNRVDYVRLADPLCLTQWTLALCDHPSWGVIAPFKTWSATSSTSSLAWYDAYNHTKHDREQGLVKATLQHTIDAVAAAYIMMVAQFGWPITAEDVFGLPTQDTRQLFEIVMAPCWTADQEYVAPIKGFQDQLGYPSWAPKHIVF